VRKRLRIPVKWGTDSGEAGQGRSEATLVISMIGEVPHMSQESSEIGVNQHHFVSSFGYTGTLHSGEAGRDSGEVGHPNGYPTFYS
jgi:hypothetical protein